MRTILAVLVTIVLGVFMLGVVANTDTVQTESYTITQGDVMGEFQFSRSAQWYFENGARLTINRDGETAVMFDDGELGGVFADEEALYEADYFTIHFGDGTYTYYVQSTPQPIGTTTPEWWEYVALDDPNASVTDGLILVGSEIIMEAPLYSPVTSTLVNIIPIAFMVMLVGGVFFYIKIGGK